MKHLYTLLFLLAFAGESYSQCSSAIKITGNGRGGYAFDTLRAPSRDIVGTYVLTMNADTLRVDSNTLRSSYDFHTNGTYRICLHLQDTITLCESDTCKDLLVEDAEYHKLLEEVNEWSVNYEPCFALAQPEVITNRSSCSGLVKFFPTRIYSENDTMIGFHTYKKIIYGASIFDNKSCILGYMREDTTERKVYFRDDYDTSDLLLYNFSMKIGDTISLRFSPSTFKYYDNGTYVLDAIKSFTMFSVKYRTYFLSLKNSSSSNPLIWLEGTGHLGYPVFTKSMNIPRCGGLICDNGPYKEISPSNFSSNVLCYSHERKVYFNDCLYQQAVLIHEYCWHFADSCEYGLICGAIHEIASLKSLNISPNPSEGSITLQFDIKESSEFEIILHAMDGRTVSGNYNLGRLSAGLQSRSLNLSELSSGFYLLECRNHEGSVFKKLVISR